ncbi:hypothetical protein [Lentilactobacillus kefiri]|uniref:hypothetical protein n=1 Tax=Lentilactobacillus kefiri TaxID=33962 RepID=UPI00345E7BA7
MNDDNDTDNNSNKLKLFYKDGEVYLASQTSFPMTDKQKRELKEYISSKTKEELKEHPYKMKLNDDQKVDIMKNHNAFIDALKEIFSTEDLDELTKKMIDSVAIRFTDHALERIHQRIEEDPKGEKIKKQLNLVSNLNDSIQEMARSFVIADSVGNKVEWNTGLFCRINYLSPEDDVAIVAENRIFLEEDMPPFVLVITVEKHGS